MNGGIMVKIHWIWILMIFFGGGFLGMLSISLFASRQIAELKHWNRKLQRQRDDAVKDAKNYREMLKIEQ